MVNNIPVNGWPQLKDLEAVQPTLDRLDKIEAWKRTVKEETFTGDDITIENALALPARSLKTVINAIQDLHGYDHPWAGGAGKNKYVGSPSFDGYYNRNLYQLSEETYNGHEVIYKSEAWNGAYKEFTVKAGVTYTFSAMVKCAASANVRIFNRAAETIASETIGTSWTKITATFTPSADTSERLRVESSTTTTIYLSEYQLEENNSATSFAPYSNICPISGRDRVVVDDTGRNIWDATADDTVYGWGGTWSKSGQTYTCVASSSSIQLFSENGTAIQASHSISVEPNSNYCVSVSGMNISQVFGVMYDKNKQFLRFVRQQTIVNNSAVIAVPSDAYYMGLRIDNNSATSGKTYNFNIQIEEGSTATAYEPYAHSSATISLGQTVYGADINWVTGVMTVKTAIVTDMGALDWTYDSTNICFKVNMSSTVKLDSDLLSSIYPFGGIRNDGQMPTADYGIYIRNTTFKVKDTKYTDATQYKTAVTGQTIEYELATPTTIQLTPEQLEMLKGYNRVTLSDGLM